MPRLYDYVCSICKADFAKASSLRRHVITMHSTVKLPHPCTVCRLSFNTERGLRGHMTTRHSTVPFETVVDDVLPSTSSGDSRDVRSQISKYFCDVCKTFFSTQRGLSMHQARQHRDLNVTCPHCFLRFLRRRQRDHHAKKCDKAVGLTLKNRDNLSFKAKVRKDNLHNKRWDGSADVIYRLAIFYASGEIKCLKCDYVFENYDEILTLNHLMSCHDAKLVSCDKCSGNALKFSDFLQTDCYFCFSKNLLKDDCCNSANYSAPSVVDHNVETYANFDADLTGFGENVIVAEETVYLDYSNVCPICQILFENEVAFFEHFIATHENECKKCPKCASLFTDKKHLTMHKCIPIVKCTKCEQCFECWADFKGHTCNRQRMPRQSLDTDSDKERVGYREKGIIITDKKKKPRGYFYCSYCLQHRCKSNVDYCRHVKLCHDSRCQIRLKTFDDLKQFHRWKTDIEASTVTYFSMRFSKTRFQRTHTQYVCNRSGVLCRISTKMSTTRREPKKTGSIRMHSRCPAFMDIFEDITDGTVRVRYCLTHVAHDRDPKKIRVTSSVKSEIFALFSEGRDIDWIMENFVGKSQNPKIASLSRRGLVYMDVLFKNGRINSREKHLSRRQQIQAIEKSFRLVEQPAREHYHKPGVVSIEELAVFPDFKFWKHPFSDVVFERGDNKVDILSPEKMQRAFINGMIDQNDQECVGYFIPNDIQIQIQDEQGVPLANSEDVSRYQLANTYDWEVKNKSVTDYDQNYFLVFRNYGVYYNEIETTVNLHQRKLSSDQDNLHKLGLLVQKRDQNDIELAIQVISIYISGKIYNVRDLDVYANCKTRWRRS